MTLEAVCVKLHIEKSIMRYLTDRGIMPYGELDDEQIRTISLIALFLRAGLEKENVVKYLLCDNTRDGKNDKARILRNLRATMLDEVHEKQKQLDKIDYIIYKLTEDAPC